MYIQFVGSTFDNWTSHLTELYVYTVQCLNLFLSILHCKPSQRTPSLGRHSHRAPSVAESMAEYFDASEVIMCETSSEAEASDESGLSDITTTSNSEPEEGHGESLLINSSQFILSKQHSDIF